MLIKFIRFAFFVGPNVAVLKYAALQFSDTIVFITSLIFQLTQIVCAHIRYIVMSTQQAQKTHFLHDVPFVCHMCADHFATYV